MKIENKQSFIYAVKALSCRTGIPYEHMLGVFNSESIGINPKAGRKGGAYGLEYADAKVVDYVPTKTSKLITNCDEKRGECIEY